MQTPRRRSDRIKVMREHAEVGTKEWEVTRVVGHNREDGVLSLSVVYKVDGSIAWIMAKYTRCMRLRNEYHARQKLIGGSKMDMKGVDPPKSM